MAWEYKVDNSSGSVHELERLLNGTAADGWRAVSFGHPVSGPAGGSGSTTVVFEREVAP